MSRTTSPSTQKKLFPGPGLPSLVFEPLYHLLAASNQGKTSHHNYQTRPQGPCSATELVEHIKAILTDTPFHGEGYRRSGLDSAMLASEPRKDEFCGWLRRALCPHTQGKSALGEGLLHRGELRQALIDFKHIYDENWIIQRHGYKTRPRCGRNSFRRCPWQPNLTLNFVQLTVDLYRRHLRGTEPETAQVNTIRLKLLKIGARMRETCRRIWVHLASGYPYRQLLEAALQNLRSSPV